MKGGNIDDLKQYYKTKRRALITSVERWMASHGQYNDTNLLDHIEKKI